MKHPDGERSPGDAAPAPHLVSLGRGGPDFELISPSDDWQYRDKDVPVPAAVGITLAEMVKPREVRRAGEDPESVVLSLSELIDNARLGWVLQAGTRLEGADEPLFLVPWPVWQEHASDIVDVWAPERDGVGAARQLAIAERETRLLRYELEQATARRTETVAIATALGMSRRRVGALLGVSGARVQQILDDAPNSAQASAARFVTDARAVLQHADGELPAGWDRDRFDRVAGQMAEWDLVEGGSPNALVVTDLGQDLLTDGSTVGGRQ